MKKQMIRVGIIGARGYTGTELLKLLLTHPYVDLKYYFYSPERAFSLDEMGLYERNHTSLLPTGISLLELLDENFDIPSRLDVIFLATPNEVSLELVSKLSSHRIHLIDLSGVFRLNYPSHEQIKEQYQKYYKINHTHPELLSKFIYGLIPFYKNQYQDIPSDSFLVANPGCYVTSVLMALKPLLNEGLILPDPIIVDAKSGTSGAGKKASENLLFSEVYNECLPYKVIHHQHTPEIEFFLNKESHYQSQKVKLVFTPHLLPIHRGIISSIYVKWSKEMVKRNAVEKMESLENAYFKYYSDYPLIDWGRVGVKKSIINMKNVINTPRTQVGYDFDEENICLFSQIDNLLKGAASQAIENMNLIYNHSPETGLTRTCLSKMESL
ncbi:MAG: N-acetyl-gamma-glutamyl-phosphate reductase [Bdellovibrionaceae bacterium]|nr:N-acetyl-gamma-glutamyl-phosphate reductase [Pseudobdellovibrionaceae bacterium]